MMRRQRVITRQKVKNQRARRRAAVVAVLMLGALAFVTARKLKAELAGASLKDKILPAASAVVGAPETLQAPIENFLKGEAAALPSGARSEALLEKFPCLATAKLKRDWLSRAAHYEVTLRKPIAAVEKAGRAPGYLSDEGIVFAAPAGLFPLTAPVVEPRDASDEELKRLAVFLPLALRPDEFLSPLARMAYLSAQDGWQAWLEDGTTLLWGNLTWTPEKFTRLREVILDARARDGEDKVKALSADLRYFEDGKILLRPTTVRAAGMR